MYVITQSTKIKIINWNLGMACTNKVKSLLTKKSKIKNKKEV